MVSSKDANEGTGNYITCYVAYVTCYVAYVLYNMLCSICYKGQVFSLYNVIYYIKIVI